MFRVDRVGNKLIPLRSLTLSEAGVREREHLQEWLAERPEALGKAIGEDLLIIQKEFDGFDGTRERLDLLALDRTGNLVVIENKLDDTGRDVVWQALKYAAYCSSLKKAEILSIYQQYLKADSEQDAVTKLLDFFGIADLDDIVLNEGNSQRVVFIATKFRREVTSTSLWLREHQIDVRCVKVNPYALGDDMFIDLHQVIPTPEAADYMIKMAEKDSEEKSTKGAQRWSHQMRFAYWEKLLAYFEQYGMDRWQNISPSRDHWLTSSVGVSGCNLVLIFLRHEVRVEFQINRPDPAENKQIFDSLEAKRGEIESNLDFALEWRRLDDKRVSVIQAKAAFQGYSQENWPEMIEWMAKHYVEMDRVLTARAGKLVGSLKE